MECPFEIPAWIYPEHKLASVVEMHLIAWKQSAFFNFRLYLKVSIGYNGVLFQEAPARLFRLRRDDLVIRCIR